MHDTATYNIVAINSNIHLYSKSLNPTPPSSFGNVFDLECKGRWFEPAVNQYFSSNNIRLLAHVFTGEDPQSEWLKREEWNRVYWFQTIFLSWVYL